jgi:hypothetical protein
LVTHTPILRHLLRKVSIHAAQSATDLRQR